VIGCWPGVGEQREEPLGEHAVIVRAVVERAVQLRGQVLHLRPGLIERAVGQRVHAGHERHGLDVAVARPPPAALVQVTADEVERIGGVGRGRPRAAVEPVGHECAARRGIGLMARRIAHVGEHADAA
jgi:hypothetical protein